MKRATLRFSTILIGIVVMTWSRIASATLVNVPLFGLDIAGENISGVGAAGNDYMGVRLEVKSAVNVSTTGIPGKRCQLFWFDTTETGAAQKMQVLLAAAMGKRNIHLAVDGYYKERPTPQTFCHVY